MLRKSLFALLAITSAATLTVIALAQTSNQLTVALANDPKSLFLPRAADRSASNAAWSLYNGLVWTNEDGDIVPALATKWDVSGDGKTYTFTLRQGVTFHNGEVFDSESVVATWETGSDKSNDYADNYKRVKEVKALDKYTVRMTLEAPDALFLSTLAGSWAMVPAKYIKQVGLDKFAAAPVGTGPFKFESRSAGDRIVMSANPKYWEKGLPKVGKLTFRVIPDQTTRLAAVQTGEIDIANRLNADLVKPLEGNAKVKVVSYPNDRVYYVAFKNVGAGKGTPLENAQVRQALNYAINRPGIVKSIFSGQANLVSGFLVPGNLGYDPSMKPFAYDPEKAKQLLKAAGFEKGFGISMGCPTDAYTNINEVCLSVQRDLDKVGIDVSLEFKTSNSYWSKAAYEAVGAMYVDSWSSTVGEALPRLTGSLIPGAFYNTWNDPELVKQINQIQITVDRKARGEQYKKLQKYMFENPPFVYLYQPVIFEAVNAKLAGYSPRSAEEYFLKSVSVSK
jgi:peptide/nickel transport system substrate-binding protein